MEREPPEQRQEQAQTAGAERKARVKRLRRRVIAASVACFALFWGVITVRMASGDDPVLGGNDSSEGSSQATPSTEQSESSGQFPDGDRFGDPDGDRFGAPPGEAPEGFLFEEGGSQGGAPEFGGGQESGESGSGAIRPESLHSGQS